MAKMPRGAPTSVPDPEGELYDREMAKLRAGRLAEEARGQTPFGFAERTLHDFQRGPRIPRPNTLESLIPVVGPAWEAAGDLQDGNYIGAAVDAASAVTDVLPVGVAFKGLRAASKGIGAWKTGSVTAGAAAKMIRRRGLAGAGEEIHHTIPLNGLSRSAQDFRNHYAFLKTLPKEQHRRLTGSWMGKRRYNAAQRLWVGTTDWMKAYPAGAAGHAATQIDHAVTQHHDPKKPRSK
jgi:hypothetical protein